MITIRPETAADYPAVYEINHLAFEGSDAEPRLVEKVRASAGYVPELSLLAELDDRLVGHILFSWVSLITQHGEQALMCLAPMAVLPDFQGRGVGARLVRHGLDECRRLGIDVVNVLGHPNYYPRFGFVPARPLGILPPFEVPDPAWMVVELQPAALTGLSGVVRYPAAFEGV